MTFPQTPDLNKGKVERQRKTLYWMAVSLRLVNRALYVACMHVLRSTYLPAYDSLIRSPYSSDPFPLPSATQTPFADLILRPGALQRETATLDLFIALKVREDVWADDSELHLERDDSFKDLFDHTQPRSRLEDLVRIYGVQDGVVSVNDPCTGHGSLAAPTYYGSGNSTPSPASGVFRIPSSKKLPKLTVTPIPFSSLAISFSPRRVGLVMGAQEKTRRTIVETERSRDELLEAAARRPVRELRVWLEAS
ncbi:hypothetical protein C8F01DRAFT_1101457 [Mycena amicta]|nr:hypothetical protein C8F01DRAFT_1101457 [Mycena amicta]